MKQLIKERKEVFNKFRAEYINESLIDSLEYTAEDLYDAFEAEKRDTVNIKNEAEAIGSVIVNLYQEEFGGSWIQYLKEDGIVEVVQSVINILFDPESESESLFADDAIDYIVKRMNRRRRMNR